MELALLGRKQRESMILPPSDRRCLENRSDYRRHFSEISLKHRVRIERMAGEGAYPMPR